MELSGSRGNRSCQEVPCVWPPSLLASRPKAETAKEGHEPWSWRTDAKRPLPGATFLLHFDYWSHLITVTAWELSAVSPEESEAQRG